MMKFRNLLVLIIVICFTNSAFAATVIKNQDKAEALKALGLFKGTETGFSLDKEPTRVEGAVMLVRMLGKETEALEKKYAHPFTDVPAWADNYVGYIYEKRLSNGQSAKEYGSKKVITASQYITFVLRSLGYNDQNGDFDWKTSIDTAYEKGILSSDEVKQYNTGIFLRDNAVGISYSALKSPLKGSKKTLIESKYNFHDRNWLNTFKPTTEYISTTSGDNSLDQLVLSIPPILFTNLNNGALVDESGNLSTLFYSKSTAINEYRQLNTEWKNSKTNNISAACRNIKFYWTNNTNTGEVIAVVIDGDVIQTSKKTGELAPNMPAPHIFIVVKDGDNWCYYGCLYY